MDDYRLAWGIVSVPVIWVGRLIWSDHKSIQELKNELAKNYPTNTEVSTKITKCSEEKDRALHEQREDLHYIRDRVDKLIDLQMEDK